MSRLRFNHVFLPLMGLSALSAFVLPVRFTDPIRATVQGVFYPIARPVHSIALWFEGKFESPTDARPDQNIRAENDQLRARLAQLTAQNESLQKLAADRRQLGDIARLCEPAQVMAPDPTGRESLSLQGSFSPSFVGRPVLHISGVVGRIERAGLGGAQVRLMTDPGFRAAGRFARVGPGQDGQLELVLLQTSSALFEGVGKGQMAIYNLQLKDVKSAGVAAGDMVVLDDPDWPGALKYREIGQVISVAPRRDAPLLAHVIVQPRQKLLSLQQVMIMVRDDFGFPGDEGSGLRVDGSEMPDAGSRTATSAEP